MRQIHILTIIIILLLIPMVSADAVTPPFGVNISGYVSSHNQIGIWWKNPTDIDLAGTQIWFDNVYIGTTSSTTQFYYAEFLSIGNHDFSTHTIDTFSNVNTTWVNITISNDGYFSCKEEWFCGDYCNITPLIPIIKTPIDPLNISQGQPPSMMSKQYTNIYIWGIVLFISLIFLIVSRFIDLKSAKPMIFAVISFITASASIWMSLSLAYMGTFAKGATIDYINQTNTQVLYYQVTQVVASPWITILCIIITIITILNAIDIGIRYIEYADQVSQEKK